MKMAGDIGAVEPGRIADLLVVNGDVSKDVTILSDRSRIEKIILGGREVPHMEPNVRSDPGGWRVSHYGDAILTQARARKEE